MNNNKYNIGDILELNIIDINYEGLGVAKIDSQVFFVSRAIKDEVVKAKIDYIGKNFIKCHPVSFLKKSLDRENDICDSYPLCGGCQLLHIKYKESLKYKKKYVIDTFKKNANMDVPIKEVIGMDNPYGYRNKIQVPISKDKQGKLIYGYYSEASHKIVPFKSCLLQSDKVDEILLFLKNICNEYKISAYDENTKTGDLRHFLIRENYKGEYMIVFISNNKEIKGMSEIVKKIVSKYSSVKSIILNYNNKHNNVILGDVSFVLYGKDLIEDKILDNTYYISHNSFFQINRLQTEKLYSKILEFVGKDINKYTILDAYCGVGSISLTLARQARKVIGIEVVPEAIEDAKVNANINNILNAEFIIGKVEDKIQTIMDENKFDVCVVDPPRKGLDEEVINSLLDVCANKIIYVSCNPATLARDIARLKEKYELLDVALVDMFPYTYHVETIVGLYRKENK